ncbi:hypothetical protein [Curtobacterium sp. SORGH_AS_0776]|uniref:hypothetical protein n=1 Tax=Curtobacterium sp. SORGH_AS_0776 TaxID=3041798 RepID=UPI00285AF817|nr:hypothetical protein [Curtobacterium sp. SORGH_AS_0776]MDR6172652.1 hypothetical protein [Curtobacterium sp. SORGH_AS_0776]
MVSALVERESEWTPAQLALVLGVEAFRRSLGPHGQPMDEAMSPDSDPSNRNGVRMYRAGVPVVTPEGNTIYAPLVDYAQRTQDDAMEAYKKSAGEGANLSGLVFPVEVIERRPRL